MYLHASVYIVSICLILLLESETLLFKLLDSSYSNALKKNTLENKFSKHQICLP